MHHPRHHSRHASSLEFILGTIFLHMAKLPFPLLALTLVLMPLFYDQGQAWWLPLLAIILTAILILFALPFWWHGRILPTPRLSPALLLFLIPLAASLIQLVPDLPGMHAIAPRVAEIWDGFNAIAIRTAEPTLTLAPDATMERAFTFALAALFCFLLTNAAVTDDGIKGLLLAITFAALGNAILAYVEMGTQGTTAQSASVSGAFLNRNHFAFLMTLGTIAALTLLTIVARAPQRTNGLNRQLWEKLALPLILIIFILLTAQVVSLSRGAFLAAAIAILAFAGLWLASPNEWKHRKKQMLFAYGVILALALAFALFFSLEKLSDRYRSLAQDDFTMDDRWLIWKDTAKLIRDTWQTGVGQGAFPHAIQHYESGNFTSNLLGHAHNDFIEFVAETGIPVSLLMAVTTAALIVAGFRKAWANSQTRTRKWAACGSLVAICGAFIHELFDFNLQAWANMLVFTAVVAAASVAVRHQKPQAEGGDRSIAAHRLRRLTTRLPWLLIAVAATAALPQETALLTASIARAELMRDMEQGLSTGKPGKLDFQRRMRLAQRGQHPMLNRHYVEKQQAIIFAARAEQVPEQASELLRQATEHIAQAASRLPTDGNTAFLNATFQRHASSLEASDLTHRQLEKLYDWAIQCQPNIEPTLDRIGMVAFQDFLDASAMDDQTGIDHHQKRARSILLKCLQLNPANLEVYDALFYLYGNTPDLLQATPENYEAMATLARLLIRKRQPEDALDLVSHILKRQRQLNLTSQQMVETLSVAATAQEILRMHQHRSQTWERLWETVRQGRFDDGEETGDSLTDPKKFLTRLDQEERKRFLTSDEIIQKAQACSLLGRKTDTVITLLQLTYHTFAPPSPSQIDKALNILGDPTAITNRFFLTRAVFLKNALRIIRAEQLRQRQGIEQPLGELQDLMREQEAANAPWLNRHLIPIFIARAEILREHRNTAVRQLRRALRICPFNVIALKLMQTIDAQALLKPEQQLLQLLGARKYPISLFKSGLSWVAVHVENADVTEKFQNQTVTYLFSCHADILQPVRLTMTYLDQEGTAFKDEITFEKGRELTFRIGELAAVRHAWQPFVKTLEQARRPLVDGLVLVRAEDVALPMPVTPGFRVHLQDHP